MGEGSRSALSDEELMRRYVDGDSQALRLLYDRYAPLVYGLARRRQLSEDDARETVQQTFFQLHVARRDFRADSHLRPWLLTIAMNLVRQLHRSRARRRRLLDANQEMVRPAAPTREHDLERTEAEAQVREGLARLPESQREVIELHWLEGLPFREVAEIVGASEAAVRVRAHRGYGRLRSALEALGVKPPGPLGTTTQGKAPS